MTYFDPTNTRLVPHARSAAIPLRLAIRRRAVCIAACTIAIALAAPSSAHAGWPLESATAVALGFGATYSAADGTPSTHRGIDIAAGEGSSVGAPLFGRVSFAGRVPGTGGGTVLAVTIETASGSLTLLPLSSAAVKAGSELAQGDSIGVLAGTGDASSSASHLHVGARKGDLYVDPLSLIAPPAPVGVPERPQLSLAEQPQPGGAPVTEGAASTAVITPSGVSALHPSVTPVEAPAVGTAVVGAGAPVPAAAPGASVAPGVSVAGPLEGQAVGGTTLDAVSAAFSAAARGESRERSGGGSPAGALVEWVLGAAARGLQTGARVLAGVLLALGALWPIWRRERRKGLSQLSVRPVGDDIAAVTGR